MSEESLQILEFIAFAFSITGVILTIRQNILCWPAHLLGVTSYLVFFFQTGYFANMYLQLFYIFMSLYGWYYWAYAGKNNKKTVPVSLIKKSEAIVIVILVPIATMIVYYFLTRYSDPANAVFDSITACLSIAGTWMMAKKIIQHWIVWIFTNCLYVYMYLIGGFYLTALLFFILIILAIKGWIEWKKSYKLQKV